jgi:hypothetical protein
LNGLLDLIDADTTQDGLISGMQRELKGIAGEFGFDFGDGLCHIAIISL